MTSRSLLEPIRRFIRNQQLIMILLAIVCGAAAAFGAVLFREAVVLMQTGTFGASLENMSEVIHGLPAWHIVLVPTAGGLLIGLFIHYLMPGRRGRGVADVMESAALRSGNISLKSGLSAAAVSAASISVGASVGREGPVVHLGATLSSLGGDLAFALAARRLLRCWDAASPRPWQRHLTRPSPAYSLH